ncbi:MAG: hypothetical protein AB7G08_26195, partial [Hyphomicrobiaceae bacterium]
MADPMREARIGHPGPPEIKGLPQLLALVGSEALSRKAHLVSPLCNSINVLGAIRCLPLARLLNLASLPFLGLLFFAPRAFALGGARPFGISLALLTLGISTLLRPLGRAASLTSVGSFGIAPALHIAALLRALLAHSALSPLLCRTGPGLRLRLAPPFNAAWAFPRSIRAVDTGAFPSRRGHILLALRRSAGAGATHAGTTARRSSASPLTIAWTLCGDDTPV